MFLKTKTLIFVWYQIFRTMDLNIFISKKGTKVVLATELHQALQLADHHYANNVKKWINDYYEFLDGIRKPIRLQEFAKRRSEAATFWQDYYLSIDLAKQICLRSKSKLKLKYATLLSKANEEEQELGLKTEQLTHLIELTKAMTLISCQEACERQHLRVYKERNQDSAANWWQYRAQVLGYSAEDLRNKLRRKGMNDQQGNQRAMLSKLEPLELIRAGIVDLFIGIGKSVQYANKMGSMAKEIAQSLELELIDDHSKIDLFTTAIDPELVLKLKKPLAQHLVAA